MMDSPLKYYCDERAFRFYILEVGEGLMILIVFPNNNVMLFDCNITKENSKQILNFLERNVPFNYDEDTDTQKQLIHFFVNSHRDEDHYRGLKKVNIKFPIKTIWDSGQSGATTHSDNYEYYMYLRRRLRDKDPQNLKVLVPTQESIANIGGANVYCFSGKEEYQECYDNKIKLFETSFSKVQHTNSLVLKIEYGGTSLLLTGDSDWKCWKEKIIPNFECNVRSEILVASHHGSRSFFTDEENKNIDVMKNADTTYLESIDYIDPDVVLISCGEYKTNHHPNKEAVKIYNQKSKHRQVYTTEQYGTIAGYIDQCGNYTVVPIRFTEEQSVSSTCGLTIECQYHKNGMVKKVYSGSHLLIGGVLKFKAVTKGGLIEPFNKVNVIWEVSNGGKWEDSTHQEIYYKDKNDNDGLLSFQRELIYKGTHLLRCSFINYKKGYITRVFSVTGI